MIFVAEIRLFSSLRTALRFSLRTPLMELFEIIGLGSSLGVGEGRTGAAVLSSPSAVPLRYLQLPLNLTSVPLPLAARRFSTHSSVELDGQEHQLPTSTLSA